MPAGVPEDSLERSTFEASVGTPQPVTQEEPAVGARLGHFRVEARIGRGGRGVVYRAYDEKLRRAVAIKVLADASPGSATWLLEEARAAAALVHPSIAAIYDVQQHDNVVFLVMELVVGTTLRAEIREGAIPLATALRRARSIAQGLARAHRSGVVHRDLKPENVMVTPEGETKILDFGLARAAPDVPPESGESHLTGVAGTPGYMAPEQALGRRVDARADVFSFGVVLWEMLAGTRPFPGTQMDEPSDAAPIAPLEELAPAAPPALVGIVMRCLEARPEERFADASALVHALATLDVARPPRPGTLRAVVVASVGVAATAALVFGLRGAQGTARAPVTAEAPTTSRPLVLALTGAPEELPHSGLCAAFPVFADDGSLIYSRQDERGAQIHRVDPATGEDTTLTGGEKGMNLWPAAGPDHTVLYLYQGAGEEGGRQVRKVALTGGEPEVLAAGGSAQYAMGTLYFSEQEDRAIRRTRLGGESEILYESGSGSVFNGFSVSSDGRWIALASTSIEDRASFPLCVAPLGHERAPLDCGSIVDATSLRPAFSPTNTGLYFARREALVRFDLASRRFDEVSLSPPATSLAIAPDAASAVYSTCRVHLAARRVDAGGKATDLPAFAESAGLIVVGPHGELAFPLARERGTALGVTDADGGHVRVITSADHDVTEAAFSPDGRRIVFHDARDVTGGLFVIDLDGRSAAVRLTQDAQDNVPGWLDDDRVVYMHPASGLPFGRASIISAAGGEARALPKVPGVLLGGVPAHGTILLAIRSPAGDRFVEATLDGKTKELPLRGMPRGMQWEVATGISPSGRYAAWFSMGAVWRADLALGTAARVDFDWPLGVADGIAMDDEGRVSASFRHSEGSLYRVRGTFP